VSRSEFLLACVCACAVPGWWVTAALNKNVKKKVGKAGRTEGGGAAKGVRSGSLDSFLVYKL
jgi:hypothetical protein